MPPNRLKKYSLIFIWKDSQFFWAVADTFGRHGQGQEEELYSHEV